MPTGISQPDGAAACTTDTHVFRSDAVAVVPIFNESAVVRTVVRELLQHVATVVCVDDGSTDDSGKVALSVGAIVLRHPFNMGQGAALQTGFEYVMSQLSHEYVATFDADGQHRACDAATMVQRADSTGKDVILGSRFLGTDVSTMPRSRRIMLGAGVRLTRFTTGLQLTDTHNGLRVVRRGALPRLRLSMPGMGHASELLSLLRSEHLSYAEHPVTVQYTEYSKAKGQSGLNAINVLHDLVARKVGFTA